MVIISVTDSDGNGIAGLSGISVTRTPEIGLITSPDSTNQDGILTVMYITEITTSSGIIRSLKVMPVRERSTAMVPVRITHSSIIALLDQGFCTPGQPLTRTTSTHPTGTELIT